MRQINIKTLKEKLGGDIIFADNNILFDIIQSYDWGLQKRVDVKEVRPLLQQILDNLKRPKIKYLGKEDDGFDGIKHYLLSAGNWETDFWADNVLEYFFSLKEKHNILKKRLKRYLQ